MISKVEILRNYHDHAIIITLFDIQESLSGMIVDDSPDDHCIFVKNPDLIEYFETKKQSVLERIYLKDMETIEYL